MAAIAMNVELDEITLDISMVCDFIDQATSEEMGDIMKAVGKRSTYLMKHGGKATKRAVASGPRAVPVGFVKNTIWVDHVLENVARNGWESFEMKTKEGVVVMEGSVETGNGTFVFPSTGKPLTGSQALGLGKHLKTTASQLWLDYKETLSDEVPVAVASKPAVARISQMALDAKKAQKEEEKAAKAAEKKAEREAVAAEKKAVKEAAKALEKAEKEAAKAAEKAAKEAAAAPRKAIVVKRVASASPQPAATVLAEPMAPVRALPKARVAVEVAKVEAKVAAAPKAAAAPRKAIVVKEWSCEVGKANKWEYNGTKYIRDWRNAMWLRGKSGEYGAWVGVYNEELDVIDMSAEDPDVVLKREAEAAAEEDDVVFEEDDE